ncbi:unnamed protein product, partial [Phaeothamnion confervicola]
MAAQLNILTFLSACVKSDWDLSSVEAASITSVIFACAAAGAVFWGRYSDRNGRRRGLVLSFSVVVIFGLASALSGNIWWLFILRGVTGFGLGADGESAGFLLLLSPKIPSSKSCLSAGGRVDRSI